MAHYDFDLCHNEECPRKSSCQRYLVYARGGWGRAFVMWGCVDFNLYMKV